MQVKLPKVLPIFLIKKVIGWPRLRHMEVPRLGVGLELQLRPMPQTQQHRIQAASATYAAACGNAGSLTH